MKWILILIIMETQGYGSLGNRVGGASAAATSAEFSDEQACLNAAEVYMDLGKAFDRFFVMATCHANNTNPLIRK